MKDYVGFESPPDLIFKEKRNQVKTVYKYESSGNNISLVADGVSIGTLDMEAACVLLNKQTDMLTKTQENNSLDDRSITRVILEKMDGFFEKNDADPLSIELTADQFRFFRMETAERHHFDVCQSIGLPVGAVAKFRSIPIYLIKDKSIRIDIDLVPFHLQQGEDK